MYIIFLTSQSLFFIDLFLDALHMYIASFSSKTFFFWYQEILSAEWDFLGISFAFKSTMEGEAGEMRKMIRSQPVPIFLR